MAINLGNIFFGLIPNTSTLTNAIGQVRQFGSSLNAAAQQAATFGQQTIRAFTGANAAARNPQATQAAISRQQGGAAIGPGGQQIRQVNGMVEALRTLSSTATLVAGPLSGVATRISVLSTLAGRFSVILAGMVAGVAAGIYSFFKLATATIEVEKALQQVQQTLYAVSGSQTIAATEMRYLYELSNRAGAGFAELAKQYSQIAAASKDTNLEGERTREIFEAVTFASSKLGLSITDTEGTLRAIQQIMSKGRVTAEELRGQLGDRLPGAFKIMADALGVTTVKLDEMLRKGEVGASALVKFAQKLKERFNIDTSVRIDTIAAAENRLNNARIRAIDTIDKQVGISQAYTNVLNKMTAGIDFFTNNSGQIIAVVGAIGGAFLATFSPTLIGLVVTLTLAISRLTLQLLGLSAALLSNPITGILALISRLTLAIGGAAYSYAYLTQIIDANNKSQLSTLPPVQEYIKAQTELKTSVRETTREYIAQQEALLAVARSQAGEALTRLKELEGKMKDIGQYNIPPADQAALLRAVVSEIQALETEYRTAGKEALRLTGILAQLDDILKRQTKKEGEGRNDPLKDLTNRQNLAIKNAQDTIKELNEAYGEIFKAPRAKEAGLLQIEINKQIENFRDVLTRAELPLSKVTELTDKYAAALKRVKEGEITLKNFTSVFQAVEGIVSRGLEKGLDAMTEAIFEGKDAFEALRSTANAVAQDIFKTFITLAALNPIKNLLFGTDYKTLGGSGGAGGVIGSIMSAFAPTGQAGGGVVGAGGAMPLKSYARGGIARGTQFAMFGEGSQNEAYVPLPDGRRIPVELRGGGGDGARQVVNIFTQQGMEVTQSRRSEGGGVDILDVHVGMMNKSLGGGKADKAVGTRYGLQPRTLSR